MGMDENDIALELSSASSWDVATRYHEFKSKKSLQKLAKKLRKVSADAVLARAQEVLGSVVHPVEVRFSPWSEIPYDADQPEMDLEETLDQSPHALLTSSKKVIESSDLWMSYSRPKTQALTIAVDTSLSMTGEKLALTAVALAVVLLQFPEDPVGILAFENEAKILKRPDERISISDLVERFLDVPAQGYTHLEEGMKAALALSRRHSGLSKSKRHSTVLLTDGKYTAGRDPAYLAPKFSHLVVMKMGKERSSLSLCEEMAKMGQGSLKEVGDLEVLPQVMYSVVKDLLRGHSV